MDSWLAESPQIPASPPKTYQKCKNCTEQGATNVLCATCKELPQMDSEIPVDRMILNLAYSDTDSDGMDVENGRSEMSNNPVEQSYNLSDSSATDSDYPIYLTSPLLQLSNSSSASYCDYYFNQDELSVPLQCKPPVCCEGSESSTSLLGRPRCEICQLNPCNTCLMHNLSRHTDLCYSCASSCVAQGPICPLCSNRIVYIYMYDDV